MNKEQLGVAGGKECLSNPSVMHHDITIEDNFDKIIWQDSFAWADMFEKASTEKNDATRCRTTSEINVLENVSEDDFDMTKNMNVIYFYVRFTIH